MLPDALTYFLLGSLAAILLEMGLLLVVSALKLIFGKL